MSLSAAVGTSVFAVLATGVHPAVQIGTGLLSVVAAVLAALQTFLKYEDKAARHRSAAASYAGMVRRIEVMLLPESGPPTMENIEGLRLELDALANGAPELPEPIWKRSLRDVPSLETTNATVELAHAKR